MPIDAKEMTELRARLRTDAAYARTALGCLSYSVVLLRIFDHRFYSIGLMYLILACLLYICDLARRRKSHLDFADAVKGDVGPRRWDDDDIRPPGLARSRKDSTNRVFGAPFRTAGWIVLAVTVVVASVEIALLVLLLRI